MAAAPPTRNAFVLDLGTSTLRLAPVTPGKYQADAPPPVALEMPALTLVDREKSSVVAVGRQAANIAKASLPSGVEVVRPWREGLVAAFDPAVALVRHALH